MSPVPDRKKQRQRYLQKMGVGYTLQTLGTLVFLAAMLTIPVSLLYGLICVIVAPAYHTHLGLGPLILSFGICGCAALTGWIANKVMDRGYQIYSLEPVPPVTSDTLPAEEVLVRGAEQPSSTSETLLRPATDGGQSPTEQLLRATNRAGSDQI